MKKHVLQRLEELEAVMSPDPLMVLANTDDGETVQISMKECLNKNLDFVKVVSGGDFHDLDLLLATLKTEANKHMD